MSGAIQSLYALVIADVISNVRQHFIDEGVDEEVLVELTQIWERNLATQRAMQSAPHHEGGVVESADLLMGQHAPALEHVPQVMGVSKDAVSDGFNSSVAQAQYQYYSKMNEPAYAQGMRGMPQAAGLLPGHAPMQMHQPSHLLYQQQQQQQQQQAQYQQYQQQYQIQPELGAKNPTTQGMSTSYMQQQAQLQATQINQHQQQPMVQYQYMPTNYGNQQFGNTQTPNNNLPQTDGATDEPSRGNVVEFEGLRRISKREAQRLRRKYRSQKGAGAIVQADGPGDGPDDEDEEREGTDADEEELGSDLDDPVEEDDLETDDLVLCQFDKVNHVKTKWKCVLKDGVVHINNTDYVFKKATGEFDWIQN